MEISGILDLAGQPRNGIYIDVWASSVFSVAPSFNTPVPSGQFVASVVSGVAYGQPGAYTASVRNNQDYWVRALFNGDNYWRLYPFNSSGATPPTPSITIVNTLTWKTFSDNVGFNIGFTPTVGNYLFLVTTGNNSTGSPGAFGGIPDGRVVQTGVTWEKINGGNANSAMGTGAQSDSDLWIGRVDTTSSSTITISASDGGQRCAIIETSGLGGHLQWTSASVGQNTTIAYNALTPSTTPTIVIASVATRGSPYGAILSNPAGWTVAVAADTTDCTGVVVYQTASSSPVSLSASVQASGGGFQTGWVALMGAVT